MATITLNTTAPEDARIGPAMGDKLGLSGSANTAQVKAHLVSYLTSIVLQYEIKVATAGVAAGVTPIAPT